jgi:hypothetical protein
MNTSLIKVGGALLLSLLSLTAQAAPIVGSIGFDGTGSGSTIAGTSTLTFGNPMTVGARIGDYAGVTQPQTVVFAPISWTGSGLTAVLTSVNSPEWTFTQAGTTYSFSLLSLQDATMSQGAVSLSGSGISTISGVINRDATFATFSAQGTGNGFTFQIVQASNTSVGQAVPDGGSTVALLGLAIMGLAVVRRKFAA